jgi:hypothetical protein
MHATGRKERDCDQQKSYAPNYDHTPLPLLDRTTVELTVIRLARESPATDAKGGLGAAIGCFE